MTTPSNSTTQDASQQQQQQQHQDPEARKFTCLYFGYASNLSSRTIRQRCPDSLFICLARLPNWKYMINQTGYANIIPSPGDEVYGSLCFLSARDEKALDESEGVPWMYQKVVMKVWRINPKGGDWGDGKDGEEEVEATVYVDPVRKTEGRMERDYTIWMKKAVEDGLKYGLPPEYAEKYIKPYLPPLKPGEEPWDMVMVRTTKFGEEDMKVPKGLTLPPRG